MSTLMEVPHLCAMKGSRGTRPSASRTSCSNAIPGWTGLTLTGALRRTARDALAGRDFGMRPCRNCRTLKSILDLLVCIYPLTLVCIYPLTAAAQLGSSGGPRVPDTMQLHAPRSLTPADEGVQRSGLQPRILVPPRERVAHAGAVRRDGGTTLPLPHFLAGAPCHRLPAIVRGLRCLRRAGREARRCARFGART